MGWQEREREIRYAVSMIRKHQANIFKKGSRDHEDAMADRIARERALEDKETCGDCQGLKIEYKNRGSFVGVILRCRYGGSPLDLHRFEKTPLGEIPNCKRRIPFEE